MSDFSVPDFPASRRRVPGLVVVASSLSTNTELVASAAGLPSGSALATLDQTAGRGRLDRSWVAPAGASLAVSALLRPVANGAPLPLGRYGWIPLAAGVAMVGAVAAALPGREVRLKWPNDVLVSGRKASGILAELLPTGDGVVVGAGLNTAMTAEQLPVPTATSLAVEGAAVDDALVDRVLADYLGGLLELVDGYAAAGGDADRSGLRARVLAVCATLGRPVRVELPGGEELRGIATDVDAEGRLVVRDDTGASRAVAAGDVTHVR